MVSPCHQSIPEKSSSSPGTNELTAQEHRHIDRCSLISGNPKVREPRKDARILVLGGPDCPPSHNADGKIKSRWDDSGDS